jgi:DNA gyrase subunit B
MEVTDRDGDSARLTEAKWGTFTKRLHTFDGWLAKVDSEFREFPASGSFAVEHRLVEVPYADGAAVRDALESLSVNGYALEAVDAPRPESIRIRVIEKETSAASHVDIPESLFGHDAYEGLRRAYDEVVKAVGKPPFTIALGKRSRHVETFHELRDAALELAKEGIQISRFKGLGEMNSQELWETTMDPAGRVLMRVEVEDAHMVDRIFSMLMGDQVEPRREFIEQNARDVRFLDV